ncbi:hypothetical protein ACLOJK_018575 [Asimina triloba]
MHSFGYRLNAVLTFAVTILTMMCVFASLSDNLNVPTPSAVIQVLNLNWFQKQPNGDDEVGTPPHNSLSFFVTLDTEHISRFAVHVYMEYKTAAEYETPENSFNQLTFEDIAFS